MNTLTKILAPAAVALFAFNAQAADFVSTGGETYKGQEMIATMSSKSSEVALDEHVNTGGEAYVGVANQQHFFVSPSMNAGFDQRSLERLYLG